jgi:divalent metal cation (Fe/Co/Zn/Cd) transporter
VALVAIVLTILTGDPVYDAVGSIVIGVLLVVVALAIGAETKSLLIGESCAADSQGDKSFRRFMARSRRRQGAHHAAAWGGCLCRGESANGGIRVIG